MEAEVLVSPCDGKITYYEVNGATLFKIKNSTYSLNSLIKNKSLAYDFCDGVCLVLRLSLDNYHRYCYIDNAVKSDNRFINGRLHTVNPVVFDKIEVFKENAREYCVLNTENFGKVLYMEVGALLVGKITNYHKESTVKRGQEKGRFEFGGSTIVLFFEKKRIKIDDDIVQNTADGIETVVKMGEKIGRII
jgi:phosphatidylserine decarboxylase